MMRRALMMLAALAFAAPAAAQTMDHGAMPGMAMPPKSSAEDPHAGHDMSAQPAASDPEAMPTMAEPDVPATPPPAAPTDHLADQFYDPAAMAAARATLRAEHGAVIVSKVMASLAEYQANSGGGDGYRWDGQAWYGGDIHRLVLKSEGEGGPDGLETAEVQALYSRAVGPYTDLQFGVRQDFKQHDHTYAAVGFETLLPYWVHVEGAAFLSTEGQLLGRVEGTYDLRLTNRLILQPRVEFNLAAQDTVETRTGSGLSTAELGLRLRYELRREFAPYVGVSYDRKFGKTGDYARTLGEDVEATSFVVGIRAFF